MLGNLERCVRPVAASFPFQVCVLETQALA